MEMANVENNATKLEEFFKTVDELKTLIEKISCLVQEVKEKQNIILSSTKQNTRLKEELELLNKETRENSNLVRVKLNSMQKSCLKDVDDVSPSVIHRIRKNQHSYLTCWFDDVMKGYHKAQFSFREKCKAQIQRQLEIVDKKTSNDELEEMLQRDSLAIFISSIDTHLCSQALDEIERRHQDIVSLESSIKELHEIFADTAMLLESQGELIDNIERNVESAAEYVDKSNQETHKAVSYKKNRHKIASFPNFFNSFRRQTKTKATRSDLNHNWTAEVEGSNQA